MKPIPFENMNYCVKIATPQEERKMGRRNPRPAPVAMIDVVTTRGIGLHDLFAAASLAKHTIKLMLMAEALKGVPISLR